MKRKTEGQLTVYKHQFVPLNVTPPLRVGQRCRRLFERDIIDPSTSMVIVYFADECYLWCVNVWVFMVLFGPQAKWEIRTKINWNITLFRNLKLCMPLDIHQSSGEFVFLIIWFIFCGRDNLNLTKLLFVWNFRKDFFWNSDFFLYFGKWRRRKDRLSVPSCLILYILIEIYH